MNASRTLPFRAGFLLIVIAGNAPAVFAQQPGGAIQERAVVMQPLQVVGAAEIEADHVVDAQTIERLQATDLEDVFRQQPTVTVGGSVGIAQKVYVRGVEDRLLNVTIDGASQAGSIFHHIGRLAIEPELLKQVEVQDGAGRATSGPGALGGAIRFETKDPEDLLRPGEDFGVLTKLGYFSNSEGYKANTTLFGRLTDDWSAMASLSQTDHDSIEDGDGNELPGTESRQRIGFAKVVGQLPADQRVSLSFDARKDEGERAQRPQWVRSSFNPVYPLEGERHTYTVNYDFVPAQNKLVNLGLTLYHTNTNLEQDVEDRWGLYYGEVESYGFDIRNTSRAGDHELVYGVDYRKDQVNAGYDEDPDAEEESAKVHGIYVQDDFQVTDKLLVTAGLRYDDYQLEDNSGVSFDDEGFSPNLGATYEFTREFSVNASYAEALRGPTVHDAFKLEGSQNDPDLEAERARNHEVGFNYDNAGWSLSGKVYLTRIDDVIGDPLFGPTRYENLGELESRGILLAVAHQWKKLRAGLTYHRNEAELDGEALNTYEHNGIGTSIGDTWVADLNYAFSEDLAAGWAGRFVTGIDDLDTSVGEIDKPGYGVHDLYGQWQPTGTEDLVLTLTIRNLLDKQYLDHASNEDFEPIDDYEGIVGLPEAGRDIRLGLAVRF
ncbi:TonB-dependent receptor domain-containing protein [Hydrocarboniclastica marina]|nr:TonB-dependent receptor [Hydrocarboniclastica marina]